MKKAFATTLSAGVLLLAVASDDDGAAGAGRSAVNPSPEDVVVTEDSGRGRAGCRPQRVGHRLIRFNTALNAADAETLRRFWVERNDYGRDRGPFAKGSFRWFSITDSPSPGHKEHFVAFQPRRAVRYVREHRGFRLQLTEVSVGSGKDLDHGLGFQGNWVLQDGTTYEVGGKGEIRCRTGWIKVWSMGVADLGERIGFDMCPDPSGGAAPGTLVMCAPRGRDHRRTPQPDPTPQSFVVTRDDPRRVNKCQPAQLGGRLLNFNRALNEADIRALRGFWNNIKAVRIRNGGAVGHAEKFETQVREKPAFRYVRRHGPFGLQLNEVRLDSVYGPVAGAAFEGRWIAPSDPILRVYGKIVPACEAKAIAGFRMRFGDRGEPIPGRDLCPDPPGGPQPGVLVLCATP